MLWLNCLMLKTRIWDLMVTRLKCPRGQLRPTPSHLKLISKMKLTILTSVG